MVEGEEATAEKNLAETEDQERSQASTEKKSGSVERTKSKGKRKQGRKAEEALSNRLIVKAGTLTPTSGCMTQSSDSFVAAWN